MIHYTSVYYYSKEKEWLQLLTINMDGCQKHNIVQRKQVMEESSSFSHCHVRLFVTPLTAAHQASLSFTNSWSLLKLMSIESVMPPNHLILCHPLLLPPSIFPSLNLFQHIWNYSDYHFSSIMSVQIFRIVITFYFRFKKKIFAKNENPNPNTEGGTSVTEYQVIYLKLNWNKQYMN